jgi:hypothetical protein
MRKEKYHQWTADIDDCLIGFYIKGLDKNAVKAIKASLMRVKIYTDFSGTRRQWVDNAVGGDVVVVVIPAENNDFEGFRTRPNRHIADWKFKLSYDLNGGDLVQGETLTGEVIAAKKREMIENGEYKHDKYGNDNSDIIPSDRINFLRNKYVEIVQEFETGGRNLSENPFGVICGNDNISQSGVAKLEKLKKLIDFAIKSAMIPPEEDENPLDHWEDTFDDDEGPDIEYEGRSAELINGQPYLFYQTEWVLVAADISGAPNLFE